MEANEELYYIQDSRSYTGNAMSWWGKNHSGYFSDISRAGVYSKQEAVAQHNSRHTDIPWPKEYIDQRIVPVIDMQYCNLSEALKDKNIKILRNKPPKKEVIKCDKCGKFISLEELRHSFTQKCPHCDKVVDWC